MKVMGNEGGILSHESIMPMNPSQVHATHALGLHGLKLGQHKDSTGAQTKSRTLAATGKVVLQLPLQVHPVKPEDVAIIQLSWAIMNRCTGSQE